MPLRPTRKPFYSQEYESWAIPLTRGVIALVDATDMDMLAQHNWYALRSPVAWYATRIVTNADGRRIALYMHRVIMSPPDGMQVDHREHYDRAALVVDNRRANLRICTQGQNLMNTRPRVGGSSRKKGVSWDSSRGKWIAQITVNGKYRHLGRFDDEDDAARAYDVAAERLYGEFGRPNDHRSPPPSP